MTAALTGRADARGTMRPRTLACTADGIWLWPGTPLTERRGVALVPIPTPQLYQHVATLHGPAVHAAALARVIERAAACLNMGWLEEAERVLAAAPLPPVSFDGAALMQAIGRRLSVSVPDVEIAGWPSASPPALFEQLARVHDRKIAVALALEPVFNPDLQRVAPANVPFDPTRHPRWPAGQPDGGQFRPRDGNGILPVQWQGAAVRIAARLLARLWRLLRRPPKLPEPSEPSPPPPRSEPAPEPPPPEPPDEQNPPGIGHNRPPEDETSHPETDAGEGQAPIKAKPPAPPSEWPFEIPTETPADAKDISLYGRRVSNAIREALNKNDERALKEIADAVSKAPWLSDQIENILTDQDPPRDLDELIERARQGARPGYNRHHIVEQGKQNDDLSSARIQSDDNIALIPTYKHWRITTYYQTKQEALGGLTPREYLRGKSFEERYLFGLRVLKKFGVLK